MLNNRLFFLWDTELRGLAKQVYSSAGFYQNFRLLEGVDYFGTGADREPLLHLWSLSIEEQFYIIFPLLCGVLWRITKSIQVLGILVGAITLGSLVLCFGVVDQRFNFYFPLTRFWELGAGIVLSYLETFKIWSARNWSRSTRDVLSVVALVMLVGAFAAFDHDTVFPGVASLLPVLGAVLLIASHEDAMVNRWLTIQPVVFVGLISYSLYLWHWPLLAFQKIFVPQADALVVALLVGVAFVVSVVIYRWVEVPCRSWGNRGVWVLLLILLFLVLLAQYSARMANHGWPERFLNPVFSELALRDQGVMNWERGEKMIVNGQAVRVLSFGVSNERLGVLAVGDSHMQQNSLRMLDLAKENGISFLSYTSPGTLVSEHLVGGNAEKGKAIMREVNRLLSEMHPKRVVIAQIWGVYMNDEETYYRDDRGVTKLNKGGFDLYLQEWRDLILRNKDTEFVFILDAPWDGFSYDIRNRVGRLTLDSDVSREIVNNSRHVDFPEDQDWLMGNQRVQDALGDVATVVDPTPWVCPSQKCNLLNYKDDDHLNQVYVRSNGVWLDFVFK